MPRRTDLDPDGIAPTKYTAPRCRTAAPHQWPLENACSVTALPVDEGLELHDSIEDRLETQRGPLLDSMFIWR
jgi:hypothetical protein